jgi:hypothetical protein
MQMNGIGFRDMERETERKKGIKEIEKFPFFCVFFAREIPRPCYISSLFLSFKKAVSISIY